MKSETIIRIAETITEQKIRITALEALLQAALKRLGEVYQSAYGHEIGAYDELYIDASSISAFLQVNGVDVRALEEEARGDMEDELLEVGTRVRALERMDILNKDFSSVRVEAGQIGYIIHNDNGSDQPYTVEWEGLNAANDVFEDEIVVAPTEDNA